MRKRARSTGLLAGVPGVSRRQTLALGFGAMMAGGSVLASAAAQNAPAPVLTRPIPHSGEALPVIGLGTVEVFDIGSDAAKRRARSGVIQTLVDAGGRLIDTAPSYGEAESVLGELISSGGWRGRIFLATKLEEYDRDTGPGELRASLRRLRTDRLDLMQLHNVRDPDQDLSMFRDWKAQGLCRYFGVTTTYRRSFDAAEAVLRREKPDFVQINYSLDDREAEQRVIPAAAEVGAAVLTALPFGRGRLFRAVRDRPLPDWAREFDARTWGQFFLKYLLGNPAVTAVIPGTGNPEHMADNLGAGRGRLPDPALRRRMAQFVDSLG